MNRFVKTGSLALAIAGLVMIGPAAHAKSAEQVYKDIKNLEKGIPLPTPYDTLTVGTFDAGTRKFTGLVTTTTIDPPDEGKLKPTKETHTPAGHANGVDVGLVFHVKGGSGPISVTANSRTAQAKPGENSVTVNIGRASEVRWTIRRGSSTYSDYLDVVRPPIIGAGAFTVPALPIGIVYEPPQDAQKRNKATYTKTKSLGTTVKMGFSKENSTTKPAPSSFQGTMDAKSKINMLGDVCAKIPNPYIQAAGVVLKAIATGLGESSATETKGTKVTSEKTLQLTTSQQDAYQTSVHEGPGKGDRIIFLKNARLVWAVGNGGLTVVLLGHGGTSTMSVGFLQENINTGKTGLSAETIQSLLKLNPFVAGGPQAKLPASRFEFVEHYEQNGGIDTHTFTHEISQGDLNASADFTTTVQDDRKGWLSFIGAGITEDKTTKATVSHSSSREVKVGDKAEVAVELHAGSDELYGIDVYYDRVFGTFAYKQSPLGTEAVVSGKAKDKTGKALAGQVVSIEAAGRKYSTRTDAQGNYAFRALALKQANGPARILVPGGFQQQIQLQGTPLRNLELR